MLKGNFKGLPNNIDRFSDRLKKALVDAARDIFDEIGITAQAKYWIKGTPDSPVNPVKLTERSGSSSSIMALSPQGGGLEAKGHRQIREINVSGDRVVGVFGVEGPYLPMHEKGAVFSRTVTERMKKFFWAKYYETGEIMYKASALSDTLQITMPDRPFLDPAAKDVEPRLIGIVDGRIAEIGF